MSSIFPCVYCLGDQHRNTGECVRGVTENPKGLPTREFVSDVNLDHHCFKKKWKLSELEFSWSQNLDVTPVVEWQFLRTLQPCCRLLHTKKLKRTCLMTGLNFAYVCLLFPIYSTYPPSSFPCDLTLLHEVSHHDVPSSAVYCPLHSHEAYDPGNSGTFWHSLLHNSAHYPHRPDDGQTWVYWNIQRKRATLKTTTFLNVGCNRSCLLEVTPNSSEL